MAQQTNYEYSYSYETSEAQNQQSGSKQQAGYSSEQTGASKGGSKNQSSSYEYAYEQSQNAARKAAEEAKKKSGSFFQCCGGTDPQLEKKLTVEMPPRYREKKDKAGSSSNNQQNSNQRNSSQNQNHNQNQNWNQQAAYSMPRAQSMPRTQPNFAYSRVAPMSTYRPPVQIQQAPVMAPRFSGNHMSRSYILRNAPTPAPIQRPVIQNIQRPIVQNIQRPIVQHIQRPIVNTVPLQQSRVAQSVPHCCHHISFCHELHNQPHHHQHEGRSQLYINGNDQRMRFINNEWDAKNKYDYEIKKDERDLKKNYRDEQYTYVYGAKKDEKDLTKYYKKDQNPQQFTPSKKTTV